PCPDGGRSPPWRRCGQTGLRQPPGEGGTGLAARAFHHEADDRRRLALASKRQLPGLTTTAGQQAGRLRRLWSRYRLGWKRREILWRAIRAGRRLTPLADRTAAIRKDDILLFATIRNEAGRLPEFLAHYRKLG